MTGAPLTPEAPIGRSSPFKLKLVGHIGSLAQVSPEYYIANLQGKIGVIVAVADGPEDIPAVDGGVQRVTLLIDGDLKDVFFYPHEVQILGAP